MFKNIENFIRGKVLFDEPMSKHTSYGIGGPAKAYITPSDKEDLKSILNILRKIIFPLSLLVLDPTC